MNATTSAATSAAPDVVIVTLTVTNNPAKGNWTPTLKNGDKWQILRVSRHSAGHVNYHGKRQRDGKLAAFSADALRLNFKAARFLNSPAAQPKP